MAPVGGGVADMAGCWCGAAGGAEEEAQCLGKLLLPMPERRAGGVLLRMRPDRCPGGCLAGGTRGLGRRDQGAPKTLELGGCLWD